MKTLLALFAAGSLAAPSAAYGPVFSGMPPERFIGDAAGIVLFVSDITPFCGPAEPGTIKIACSFTNKDGTPIMVMPDPCPLGNVEFYARIACHERAHWRGWSGNHEL